MKAKMIFIILSWTVIACGQDIGSFKTVSEMDSLLANFSAEWRADSLGQNGFRMKHNSFDSINKTWLINGLHFKGHSEEQIIKWLGQPRYSGRHKEDNGLIMTYAVGQNSKDPDIELLIYFNENDKVDDIIKKIGLPK